MTEGLHLDGWANALTSMGTQRDPGRYNRPDARAPLSRYDAETLYQQDGIARRAVDEWADDMTREWVEVQGDGAEDVAAFLDARGVKHKLNRALRWAGLYGGAVAFLLCRDGSSGPEKPLRWGGLRDLEDVHVYDRHRVTWTAQDLVDDPRSTWYGLPATLWITPPWGGAHFQVHRSRLLLFDGEDVPDEVRQRNNGWGDSRLQPIYESLGRYGEALNGVASIIRDYVQPTLSMNNLSDMMASGQEEVVKKRLDLLALSRSTLNVMLLDAENEQYEKKASTVSGVDQLIEHLRADVSAQVGMPQTKLWGRSPAGMNATGDADLENWYTQVHSEQEVKLLPQVRYVVKIADRVLRRDDGPEDRGIKARPLWQLDEQERAGVHERAVRTATQAMDWDLMTDDEAREYLRNFGLPVSDA